MIELSLKNLAKRIPFVRKNYWLLRNYRYLDGDKLLRMKNCCADDLLLKYYATEPLNGNQNRRKIIEFLHSAIEFEFIIETGTFVGATTEFFLKLEPTVQVKSVELSKVLFDFSVWRFRNTNNIEIRNQNSEAFLNDLDMEISHNKSFVYLDAHWNDYLPLRDELSVCTSWKRSVIMIDDFRVEDDDSFAFDDSDDGGGLDLAYISDLVSDWSVYFPNFCRDDDSGFGAGFVIINKNDEFERILNDCQLLRRFDRP